MVNLAAPAVDAIGATRGTHHVMVFTMAVVLRPVAAAGPAGRRAGTHGAVGRPMRVHLVRVGPMGHPHWVSRFPPRWGPSVRSRQRQRGPNRTAEWLLGRALRSPGADFSAVRSSEWRNRQTRQLEGLVPERAWGFKSPLRHRGQQSATASSEIVDPLRRGDGPSEGKGAGLGPLQAGVQSARYSCELAGRRRRRERKRGSRRIDAT